MKRLIRCSEIGNYVFSSSEPPSLAAKEVEIALGDFSPNIIGLNEIYREYCPEGFSGPYSPGGRKILEAVEQGRLLLISESQTSNSSFGGFHKYQKKKGNPRHPSNKTSLQGRTANTSGRNAK